MTQQQKIQYIESILASVHAELYPHSPNNKTGYNCNWIKVLTSDLDDAIELLEMNNLRFEAKENPYYYGYTDITIHTK